MRQPLGRRPAPLWAIILIVALHTIQNCAYALQQAGNAEHEQPGAQSGPMMSLGQPAESSPALEASGALASDDLIAAESSRAPADAPAEHKAFTSAQMLRQVS